MSSLQAIDRCSVQRLCSAQVITDISSIVKELLENSLDGEATCVEVRLREYGKKAIEVVDDGLGIKLEDFDNLCLRGATSKCSDFEDLDNLSSFGFRGEALSSIANIAKLSVLTRPRSSAIAYQLQFDSDGQLLSKKPTARQMGTTVCVGDIFYSLPVRRKEFEAKFKQEFGKVQELVQRYCLTRLSCTVTLSNEVNGQWMTVLKRPACASLRLAVGSVFGTKQAADLVELAAQPTAALAFRALVSKVGAGRCKPDRQFVFVNERPCVLPVLNRQVNDVFAQFDKNRYPFVCLHVTIECQSLDVNVTPDKRTLFVAKQQEMLLMEAVRDSVTAAMEGQVGSANAPRPSQPTVAAVTQRWSPERPTGSSKRKCTDMARTFEPLQRAKRPSAWESGVDDERRTLRAASSRAQPIRLESESSRVGGAQWGGEATTAARDHSCASGAQVVDTKRLPDDSAANPNSSYSKSPSRRRLALPCSWPAVAAAFRRRHTAHSALAHAEHNDAKQFFANLADQSASDVEKELSRQLAKEDFGRMRVLGQFNEGFILAQLDAHVFIVDQHASDEKFNYEQLRSSYTVKSQRLLAAVPLQLTSLEQQLLEEHLDVLQLNGFAVAFDRHQPPGQQMSLTAVPMVRGAVFGKEDISELLFVLSELPVTEHYRPSRVAAMLASKACRKSVMIGTPLSRAAMGRIVRNMGTMRHPWNCPHGRPTLRHLLDLGRLPAD